MPRNPKAPDPVSRYSLERVRLEIKNRIDYLDQRSKSGRGTRARLARALHLTSQQLTKRLNGDTDLSIPFIGAIADSLHAPPGWPFEPWHVMERRAPEGDGAAAPGQAS